MTDVADEHEAASRQRELATAGCGVVPVPIEHPQESGAVLVYRCCQVALVQAEPVPITQHLVGGVHGGHRVLEVHDRGDRGFQDHVLDAGPVGGADLRLRIDQDLDVQTVID
ncbi:Uncharacterised protein [Mycobacterium tuberculosis]|uniref:Uncharacterized protein n=1 Tax=Mycobacterium tuberculosis TaxID=1773 RepID=A0A0U0S301_MYCTX|nr:hypothetical protein CAB90_02041 [Mycobacterium tuberculosis]CFE41221.1 Uncharacterised protein [Mycobacterium tuberculosis]CKS48356.1 Uncharacterised protein [Mycobacterium tuberculosis]COV33210.1 Uncharacterised protein [Mycobacterium tuberculosis]COW40437.1 Uncharacterised protein [Mycobacterium tuberculosis]